MKLFGKKEKPAKLTNEKPTAVKDILRGDDLKEILNLLAETSPHISDIVIVYIDKRDECYHSIITQDTLISTAVWMLASVQNDLLNNGEEK